VARSSALDAGSDGIANWLDSNVDVETRTDGKRNVLGQVVDGIRESAKELRVADDLLWIAAQLSPEAFGLLLSDISTKNPITEHFAAEFGYESLRRAQIGVDRLPVLLTILAQTAPPDRATKYLRSAATCFLLGLDRECVAMCRGAVEVLVEEGFPDAGPGLLGKRIIRLRDGKKIASSAAEDMLAVNEQAKEVLHDEVARVPPDAEDCLRRLSRLLGVLFPNPS
jgi:hypothetical protein